MLLDPSRELVLQKLHDTFPNPQTAHEALALLDTYGTKSWHYERERVQLACLKQSNGDLDRLRLFVELADKDFRDALVGAEYPEGFPISSEISQEEKLAIQKRDREQYEAWLRSGAG